MTLAKLFTIWKLHGVVNHDKSVYTLDGLDVRECTVDGGVFVNARLIYSVDVSRPKNVGVKLLRGDVYMAIDGNILVRNCSVNELAYQMAPNREIEFS